MELGATTLRPVGAPDARGALAARVTAPADPYQRATVLLVHVLVLAVGLDQRARYEVALTIPAAIVLFPLWAGCLRRYRLASLILGLGVAAPLWGMVLAERSSIDHAVSSKIQVESIALLLSGLAAFVLVLWARELVPLHRIVVLYAIGALASDLLASRHSWKFDLSLPATILVLGLVERNGIRWRAAAIVMAFGISGLLDDSRSFVGFCALAAALTIWQLRPRTLAASRWFPAMMLVALSMATYLLVQSLLTGGYLGSEAQARSLEQTEATGSLLTGGRPEWSATRELVGLNPVGYGPGVVPSWTDLQAGKKGLLSINIELEDKRQSYMFGEVFNLHSITSDLWAGYGFVGVALAVVMVIGFVRSLSFSLAARAAPTSVILLSLLALWFMLFGPIYSNWLHVCVALGLALVPAGDLAPARRSGRGPDYDVGRDELV